MACATGRSIKPLLVEAMSAVIRRRAAGRMIGLDFLQVTAVLRQNSARRASG
jgi:hypothetical protein